MLNKFRYIIFPLLFTVLYLGAADKPADVITKSFRAAKGGKLHANLNPGEIFVNTWDKDEVLVKVDGLDEDEAMELKLSQKGNTIEVEYEGSWGWGSNADYYFTVPETFDIELNTTGGDIEIGNDLTGNAILKTMGGDVTLMSIDGNLKIETMGGDIDLNDVTGNAFIATQGGDISARNLTGTSSEVKTMGGDIVIGIINKVKEVVTYGGDITIDECRSNIEIATFGGDIDVKKAMNGVKAKTYGGDIYISEANGFVDASTGGGNINLYNITGAVKARTGAGSIYVDLNPTNIDKSDIRTTAGNVELVLNPNARATVEAEVEAYGWGKNRENNIISDFQGKITEKRNDLIGIYEINGGGALIEIEATNGTIYIKKGR